mgnify:CR=1 FL=1
MTTEQQPCSPIARTGRVQNWLDDPTDSLPVSCTITSVEDSMWGENGIVDSFAFTTYALQNGAGVAVHLSKLRPAGTIGSTGKVASGPCAFAPVYSALNHAVRKGNKYKNGAVVLHLDLNHADILDFLRLSRAEVPWVKRCVGITEILWENASREVRDELLAGIAKGDIWLAKVRHDQYGRRIFSNVCLEVNLLNRGTCLLQHVSLGGCEVDEIPNAFATGMSELIELHAKTGVDKDGWYRSPANDRQVGLGMLGLANLLAIEGVTYAEFADALEEQEGATPDATRIVERIQEGLKAASKLARAANMDRAFAIAPTASCSYRYTDRAGYTTAPELAPPIGRLVDRDSSTFGVQQYNYGNVETAEEVGFPTYFRVVNGIMKRVNSTGLAHGYSFNTWSDDPAVRYDDAFIEQWLASPQSSMYYSLQVKENTQAKDDSMVALDGEFEGLFDFSGLVDEEVNEYDQGCVGCAE